MTQVEKFRDVLKGFRSAVLITHGENGKLHGRPMMIAEIEENCDLWFVTGEASPKVHEIESDHRAHIVCQDGESSFVSVSGVAELVHDRDKVREIWSENYRTWFPGGVDDPTLMLIHFRGEEAEYWDNRGMNKVKYMYEATKAYFTGTTPDLKEGQHHEEVRF